MQTTHVVEEAATMSHDSPLLRVHSLGSDEGSMTLHELTILYTTLSKKVESLESELKQTKLTYGAAYSKLIMKLKKLENIIKSSKARRRVRLVVSEDEDDLEDPSKQGRKIAQLDKMRTAEIELEHEGSKRQKTNEEQSTKEENELSEEELQKLMMIVPVEEVYVEALQIWSLVKERFSSTDPTNDKERTLWVELKRLFKPDTKDILWKLQRYMHDPLTWRLYDTCSVHHVSTDRGHDIFMLVEKDYPLTRGLLNLMLCNKLQVDQYSEMANGLLKKIFILANIPRQ
ncbi:hypothetical protein Tco_0267814 [Tanacetum coccineum]